ncbi:hypothetical protein P3X46_008512 [Hevea brasiliensis]|uniref:SANT domain-containing protein n=1 Tax=Hevea brasiliensis TaxID=3981 RepID=A0ABQ9MIU7_HEVBR|nr:uncharacterized protein LOC110659749 isoform X2 [Hevea brasiliensis]XP_021673478.2 uncharacterized protein LOC110659749 isoform X2 [Hevea brasiliensis]KAJ9180242.1 hypothetical protein P3X46_008512 [Hevea brasiliensis]
MEMEPIPPNNDCNSIEESSFQQLVLPSSPEISGISGDPQVNPRVGDEYQAEIPPMISEYEHFQLLLDPFDSEVTIDDSHSFLIGLPILVTWVHNTINNIEDEGCRMSSPDDSVLATWSNKSRTNRKNNILKKKGSNQNAEPLDLGFVDGKEPKPAILGPQEAGEANLSQLHKSKRYDPVPVVLNHPWSDADVDSFILGLYIFGKNFVQIERFLENKKIGEILSFYYGEFYRSDGYNRWSDCQKTKRKKCIYGQKIFTGWRQQELLSRLHPHVPVHSQNNFLEVSTAFSEGKFSLEDYVSNLRAVVGIQALVDAIGIGKGKEDLTSLAMEPARSNPLFTVCPIGKACSSLTSSDIIKLLTGGFRLSKARSNDIFWEAVWPRLLARGWHSEQPNNQSYVGPNHHLVFLIPGVKKFSKRKLVKGNHYFDSVSDVLSKVASEPKLIELDSEEARGSSCNEEDRWVVGVPSGHNDASIQQSFQYLKPRVSNYNLNLVSFTVVDSGLLDGGKSSKMREMRYAPEDLKVKSLLTTLSSSIEMMFSENSLNDNELDAVDMSLDGEKNINNAKCYDKTFDGHGSNLTKFTIVDTSLIHAGKSQKVRELRYSPIDIIVTSEMTKSSRKKEGDSSDDSMDRHVLDATKMLSHEEKNVRKSNHTEDIINSSGSEKKALNRDIRNKLVEGVTNNESNENQSTRTIKHKFSRRSKSGLSNNLVPAVKRRRLISCSSTELSHVIDNFSVSLGSKQEGSYFPLNPPGGSNTFQVNPPRKLSLNISLAEGSLEDSTGGLPGATCFGMETSHRQNVKRQTPSLIDLNLPQLSLDCENNEAALMDVESSHKAKADSTLSLSSSDKTDPEALSTSVDASPAVEQPSLNPRRQSRRNRPLTTRALEALECGFLGVKRQKSLHVPTQEISYSSSSHWVHSKVKVRSSNGNAGSGIVNAKDGDANGAFNKKDFV